MTVQLTLLGKPGCHLCDDARAVVDAVIAETTAPERAGGALDVRLDEVNILDDPALARQHGEYIPVLLVDGKRHAFWRVDAAKLTAAVEKAARPRRLFGLGGTRSERKAL